MGQCAGRPGREARIFRQTFNIRLT